MGRGPRAERDPLTLAEAPDVLDVRQVARIMRIGLVYAAQLIREGYLLNIGGAANYRVPKESVRKHLDEITYEATVLPPRRSAQ